jgi:Mrp family chromosome partitioning ATPase/uncharacterized protein involved in exopolysaccharide biosynthesis
MNLARITDVTEQGTEFSAAGVARSDRRMEIIHALMRGRYRWAILLAILLAAPAGWGGYKLGKPIYQSDVPIRIELTERRVLYTDEEKAALPQYESFMDTQMALIKSQRVIDLAMQDPGWTQLRRTDAPDATLQFLKNLTVEREDELITVTFSDPSPQAAMAGAEAVVKAYRKLYLEEDAANQTRRLEILQQLETALSNELESKTQRLASVTAKYGVHDVQRLTDGKYEELHMMEMKLADLELQMALIMPTLPPPSSADAQEQAGGWTADDFASSDPVLATSLAEKAKLQVQLADCTARGLGENNRIVQSTKFQLAYLQRTIDSRMEKLRRMPERATFLTERSGDPTLTSDPKVLAEQLAAVRTMKDKAETEYQELDQVSAQTDDLHSQMEETKKRLDDTQARIEQLNVESEMSGRITFPTDAQGERPLEPYKDTRRRFAAAGGLGAGMLGFAVVLGITLLDRRVRNAEEVSVRLSVGQLLGVLPALPGDMSEPEDAAAAAHSVHQIRSMLQVRASNPKPCFAITSPLSGSGKTSLSLALAFSFASTGAKTLIVDCDLVGGGLTRKLNATARKRIGSLLRKEGLIDTAQLRVALKSAKSQGRQLGQVLIEMGFATEQDIDACLVLQGKMSVGLIDAVKGEPLLNCVTPTGIENCYVLPVGGATAHHAVSLSPSTVKRMIESARKIFDVIIIDSGPIPGSLEASAVAVAVDSVVMLVSRGEPRALVEQCLSRLRRVGAPLAGVVLNRVESAEMFAHGGSVSLNSRNGSSSGMPGLLVRDTRLSGDVGPIASAVVCSTPAVQID